MQKKVLVPVADGTEELEAVTTIDVLRRAKAEVCVASVDGIDITASRGVVLKADCLLFDCTDESYDLIAIPGGMPGAEHLRDSVRLASILKRQNSRNGLIAAICASPFVVLHHLGILDGRHATCHPSFKNDMPAHIYADDDVVVDNNCITSKGPGTAMAFALKLVEVLYDRRTAESIAMAMCIKN